MDFRFLNLCNRTEGSTLHLLLKIPPGWVDGENSICLVFLTHSNTEGTASTLSLNWPDLCLQGSLLAILPRPLPRPVTPALNKHAHLHTRNTLRSLSFPGKEIKQTSKQKRLLR